MDDQYQLDYIHIASQIYTRLELEYGFAAPKDHSLEDLWAFLASQLKRLRNEEVQCWNEALNKISDEGNEFPPKIPRLLQVMRGVAWRAEQNNKEKKTQLRELEYQKKVIHLDTALKIKQLAKKAAVNV